jgi:hypothetical protein
MASDVGPEPHVFQRLATVVALETRRHALSGCDKGPLSGALDPIQER